MYNRNWNLGSFMLLASLLVAFSGAKSSARQFDLVVYGATPSGIAAAVNAGREGLSVVLVDETYQVGGMTAAGLAHSDFYTFQSLGGTWKEFMDRVQEHYRQTYGESSDQHLQCGRGGYYEPKVARKVFEDMLASGDVTLMLEHRVVSVVTDRDRVSAATFVPTDATQGYPRPLDEPAIRLAGDVFIDATYEGDLLAAAGVPYRLGTDARSDFNEPLAPASRSDAIMAMNFRVCLSRDPDNRRPIPKPDSYDRTDHLKVLELIESGFLRPTQIAGPPWPLDQLIRVRPVPNLKSDFNDRHSSPFSIKLVEEIHEWPEANAEKRAELFDLAKERTLGMFWFLANDPELPQWVRDGMNHWGLPKDEFVESANWPPVIYVREGRRLRGVTTFTQHDAERAEGSPRARLNSDSIAIGNYSINSHGTHHLPDGTLAGTFKGYAVPPFQIPYGALVPKEIDGLLASVPVSASHVGYCAIRMEPTWTALGQAAGVAATYAVKHNVNLRDVPVHILQRELHSKDAFTVYIADVPPESPYFKSAQYFGTLGFFHELDDTGSAPGFFDGPPVDVPSQWTDTPVAGHALLPDTAISEKLAASWINRFMDLFPDVSIDRQRFVADGTLTRGEFLNRLFAAAAADRITVSPR